MSAEVLRKAAALMRERAEAATPGPWQVNVDNHRGFNVPEVSVWAPASGEYVTEDVVTGPDSHFPANADHVASWGPVVALEIAAFLNFAAAYGDQPSPQSPTVQFALSIARAYLEGTN